MPRILILHASLGTGHVSAAEALGEAFRHMQPGEVRVEDVLAFGSALFRETMHRSYLSLSSKLPPLWKMLYESSDVGDVERSFAASYPRSRLSRAMVTRLDRFVGSFAPDVIVCTHALPVDVLQVSKEAGGLAAPIYTVVTDFMVHTVWLAPFVDGYFVASDLTRDAMIARGVSPSIVHVTGIPVRLEIAEPKPPAAMRARHGLPAAGPVVACFGGGLEPERARRLVAQLLALPVEGTLVVVAGRNRELQAALADLTSGPRLALQQHGRIDFVDDLVAASDLVVTKAGGLMVSEVLARGTPLVILDPIPGQEEWNADYVVALGAGCQLRQPETAALAVQHLLAEPERLAAMRNAARRIGHPRAALAIAEHVLADLAASE